MAKRQQRERIVRADIHVSVHLHGWPGERRMLSVVDPCWMVDLEFREPGRAITRTLNHFTSASYDEAYVKYEALAKICGGIKH